MTIKIAGGIALIVFGAMGILMLFPGIAETLSGLLKRPIPTDKWTRSTKVAVGVLFFLFLASGFFFTLIEINVLTAPPSTPPPGSATPTLSITSVPFATHTPSATFAPSATDSPRPTNTAPEIDTPTKTPAIITPSSTPTPTSISSLNYMIADCIDASAWNFWQVSITPPRDINQPNCLDLSKWGFAAQNQNLSDERQGLRINVDASAAATHGIYIFLPNEEEIDLVIEIDELSVKENCAVSQICDANLIFGIGDPILEQGWFLVYRATSNNSPRLTCFLNSNFAPCNAPLFKESPPFEGTERKEIKFNVNRLDVVATINGATFNGPNLSGITRIFWIGYHIRSVGSIRAFVSFSK